MNHPGTSKFDPNFELVQQMDQDSYSRNLVPVAFGYTHHLGWLPNYLEGGPNAVQYVTYPDLDLVRSQEQRGVKEAHSQHWGFVEHPLEDLNLMDSAFLWLLLAPQVEPALSLASRHYP